MSNSLMAIHVLLYSTNIMTSKIVTVLTDLTRTLQKGMSCCLSASCYYKHVVKPNDLIKKKSTAKLMLKKPEAGCSKHH